MLELATLLACLGLVALGYAWRASGDSQRNYIKAMRAQRRTLNRNLLNRNRG